MNALPVHSTASSNPTGKSSLYSFSHDTDHRQPSQHRQPLTFMLEKVLTDAVDTFRMRTQSNLSLIGNFPVIKEEEEVCFCSCIIIHLQKTKKSNYVLSERPSNTINGICLQKQ